MAELILEVQLVVISASLLRFLKHPADLQIGENALHGSLGDSHEKS